MKPTRAFAWLFILASYLSYISCNEAKYMQGKRTYDIMCGDCHMEDGSGVKNLYPKVKPLNSTIRLGEIPCIIRHGLNRETSLIKMPPNPSLQPVDITNIINYLLNDLNEGEYREYTMKEIEALLEDCQTDNPTR